MTASICILTAELYFTLQFNFSEPLVSLWDCTLGLVTLIYLNYIMVTPFAKIDCLNVFFP